MRKCKNLNYSINTMEKLLLRKNFNVLTMTCRLANLTNTIQDHTKSVDERFMNSINGKKSPENRLKASQIENLYIECFS